MITASVLSKKMMPKAVFPLLLLSFILIAAGISGCKLFRPYSEYARFTSRSGVEVVIFLENSWEVTQGVYYTVQDGDTHIPMTYLWGIVPPEQLPPLELWERWDNNVKVIGVVERDNPTKLLMAYDGITKKSWPRDESPELEKKFRSLLCME